MSTPSTLVACLIGLCSLASFAADSQALSLDQLRKLRHEAAHRSRRMIFNNDGDDVIYTKKEITPEALLALRTTPLLGSQVDSIFYSNSLCFGDALHNSEVFTPFVSKKEMFSNNAMAEYLQAGIDPIQVMADFGHANGIEIFWDMRMNDTHDAGLSGYGPLLVPKLKKDHPEFLVGAPDKQPPLGTWSSVDYAHPEIRDLCYRFFEEVCRKFDVDGVELDFFRHPCYFKSVAWGKKASREELDAMTDLVRRIRQMTEREGMRRGRPILIAIRVPDSVEFCKGIGLDVETWLSEGLVDLLSGSGYFRLNPWEYLISLGHRYDVPVYPCLSDSRVKGQTRFSRNSIESYRARATNAWAAGADGIYMFNYFNPRGPVWRELGDPQGLAHKDKLYFATVRDGSPDRYLSGGSEYRNGEILTPSTPRLLSPDEPTRAAVLVSEDLAAALTAGAMPEVTCHVRAIGADHVRARVNGEALGNPTVEGEWADFAVRPEQLVKGTNAFELSLAPPAEGAAQDDWDVVYDGSALPGPPWTRMGFYTKDCVAEVRDGKLLLADRGTQGGTYAYYRYPCFVVSTQETVIEARAKVLSGWCSVIVENGVNMEEVQLLPDRVRSRYTGIEYAMDTTDDFHDYRIVIQGKSFKVYVDGELRLDGTDRITASANGRHGISFGGANSPNVGEALWESVKIRNPARALLDLAVGIRYGQE